MFSFDSLNDIKGKLDRVYELYTQYTQVRDNVDNKSEQCEAILYGSVCTLADEILETINTELSPEEENFKRAQDMLSREVLIPFEIESPKFSNTIRRLYCWNAFLDKAETARDEEEIAEILATVRDVKDIHTIDLDKVAEDIGALIEKEQEAISDIIDEGLEI